MVYDRSQRYVERRSRCRGIVEEQHEKIAHAIEEHAIARLFLERPILRHHRLRGGGRGVAVRGFSSGGAHRPVFSAWGAYDRVGAEVTGGGGRSAERRAGAGGSGRMSRGGCSDHHKQKK